MSLLAGIILLCCVSAINKGDVKDTEIEAIIDCIVNSLFSVFVTLGELMTMLAFLSCCLLKIVSN